MKTKRWVIAAPDRARVGALSREGGYAPLTAAVLAARGIDTPQAAAAYLSRDRSGLCDPLLLTDMDKAVAVIRSALERGEHIVVYGDYDVDGVTAAVDSGRLTWARIEESLQRILELKLRAGLLE